MEYRDLSFDAKIVYASKYGENVWSDGLVYSDEIMAAVGPDNKPLPNQLVLDNAGNIVSYDGIPLHDMETLGFPTEGSWEEQKAKLREIRKSTKRLRDEEVKERSRVHDRQKWEENQKNKARVKKLEEGLEKLRKANELKNKGAVQDPPHD